MPLGTKFEMDLNTVKGISSYITDLKTLHSIGTERRKLHEAGVKLDAFIVMGRWHLDQFGQILRLKVEHPNQKARDWGDLVTASLNRVVHMNDFMSLWKDDSQVYLTSYYTRGPTPEDVCPHCSRGWTLSNAHNSVLESWAPNGSGMVHPECLKLVRAIESRRQFDAIFRDAGFTLFSLLEIPNEYFYNEVAEPWYLARTVYGDIKIGWRKRVINIDWQATGMSLYGESLTKENVTKGATYIHAWGTEKAVEYLKQIRNELENSV